MPSSVSTGNATTGQGTPCFVHVSGAGITAAGVDLTTSSSVGNEGQGHGAIPGAAGSSRPNAQYALTLSLTGATVNGVTYPTTTEAIASLVDVLNNSVPVSEYYATDFVWQSLGCPPPNSGYYKRSNSFVSTTASPASKSPAYPGAGSATPQVVTLTAPYGSYDADIVITATAVGKCTVEVSYPVFDNPLGDNDGYLAPDVQPVMAIVARIDVSVIA